MKGVFSGLSQEQSLQLAAVMSYDLVWYCRNVLKFNPTEQQEEVLRSIGAWALQNKDLPPHKRVPKRIAIKSGRGTGKSRLLAAIMHWFETTRRDSVTVCTAPKASQLQDVIWREFALLQNAAVPPFNDHFEIMKEEIRHKESPKTQMAIARTARKENPEALQGIRAQNMMILCDEASGIPEEIFIVMEGSMSNPGCLVIMAANPTRVEGTFYNAFGKDREIWESYTFNRAKLDPTKYPFLDPHFPERMAIKYGRDSNIYRVHVLGEFPCADPDTLIPLWQVEAAVDREITPAEDDVVVYGVDVARFGDDESVLVKRKGNLFFEMKSWRQKDTMQLSYEIHLQAKKDKPAKIFVDTIGVGGGVADRLRDLGWDAVDVNVSERPSVDDRFYRLRDQLWWNMKEVFENGTIAITEECADPLKEGDSELVGQLSTVKYRLNPNDGKLRIETKDERKRRGLHSPDRAEAMLMTFTQSMTGLRPEAMAHARARLTPSYAVDF